uniref:RNA helicase n=1 Tax=Glossina morsitans morsitans TaxID=37546 RepID=A0A1B0ETB3_GLOMM
LLIHNNQARDFNYHPKLGEKVAVNFVAWNKTIRAEILGEAGWQKEFIVWALDYGFPFRTKEEYVFRLPTKMTRQIDHIRCGGLANILPAENEYDYMEDYLAVVKKDNWPQSTCDILDKFLMDAASITFVEHFKSTGNHCWGNLFVVDHRGEFFDAREHLLSAKLALEEATKFQEIIPKLKTTSILQFLSNNGKLTKKTNTIRGRIADLCVVQNSTSAIDEHAKRKVEDWRARNKRQSDLIDVASVAESSISREMTADDVAFDDSVSAKNFNSSDDGRKVNVGITNYIGKAGTLAKIKVAEDKLKWPGDEHFKVKIEINRDENSSPDLTNVCMRTENLLRLRTKYAHLEEDCSNDVSTSISFVASHASSISSRSQQLMELREKYKEHESSLTTLSLGQTYALGIIDHKKTLDAKMDESNSQRLRTAVHSPSLLKDQKCKPSDQTNSITHYEPTKSTRKCAIGGSEDEKKKHFHGMSYTTLSVTNDDKENVEQESIKMESEEELIKSYKLKCPREVNPMNIKKNLASPYNNLIMVPGGFNISRLTNYRNEDSHWHRMKSMPVDKFKKIAETKKEVLTNEQNGYPSLETIPSNRYSEGAKKGRNLLRDDSPTIDEKHAGGTVDTTAFPEDFVIKRRNTPIKRSPPLIIMKSSRNNQSRDTFKFNKDVNIPTRHKPKLADTQFDAIHMMYENVEREEQANDHSILDSKSLNTSFKSKELRNPILSNSYIDCNKTPSSSTNQILLEYQVKVNSETSSSNESNLKDVIRKEKGCISIKHKKQKQMIFNFEGKNAIPNFEPVALAHSNVPLYPLKTVSEAQFLPQIHKEMLNMRIKQICAIQMYAWPHMLRNNSIFIISPSKSGKTWSYLPALCNDIYYDLIDLKSTFGPVAIVLVASMKHVEQVSDSCRRLMSALKDQAPVVVASFGLRNFRRTKTKLLKSCGMLVITPSSLLRLLNDGENKNLFNGERLKRIVIDDMGLIMSRAQKDFAMALGALFTLCKKSGGQTVIPQIAATSCRWDVAFIELTRLSNQPLLLITDFLEATIYGKVELSIKLRSKMEKKETMQRFLKKCNKTAQMSSRTMIICNEDYEVREVRQFLAEYGYLSLGYSRDSAEIERIFINEWKRKKSDNIFVCTDGALVELQIRNVQNLIHYSMPTSWTQFNARFSVLVESYDNLLADTFAKILPSAHSSNRISSLILLDDDNNLQLPRLVDFMRMHQQIVRPHIQAMANHLLLTLADARVCNGVQLCPDVLDFGECDEFFCNKRHEVTSLDVVTEKDDIPMDGEIRIHILKTVSPCHYIARLLEHKPHRAKQWVEIRHSRKATAFALQLDQHYHHKNNRSHHWLPLVGDICVYKYSNAYRRVCILDILTFSPSADVVQDSLKLTLKLIDDGEILKAVQSSDIFICHQKFKDFPYQAIDIRLINMVPYDNERVWDSKSTKLVRKWIMDDINDTHVVQATVNFAFASNIWINNLFVMEKLSRIGVYKQLVNLKKTLIENQLALCYVGDRKSVYDVVSKYGLLKRQSPD